MNLPFGLRFKGKARPPSLSISGFAEPPRRIASLNKG
jgi:hypothetical protein